MSSRILGSADFVVPGSTTSLWRIDPSSTTGAAPPLLPDCESEVPRTSSGLIVGSLCPDTEIGCVPAALGSHVHRAGAQPKLPPGRPAPRVLPRGHTRQEAHARRPPRPLECHHRRTPARAARRDRRGSRRRLRMGRTLPVSAGSPQGPDRTRRPGRQPRGQACTSHAADTQPLVTPRCPSPGA